MTDSEIGQSADGIEQIKFDLIRANNATDPKVDESPKYGLIHGLRGIVRYFDSDTDRSEGGER
ncbi:hypothetical protein HWV23_03335 [Natronomonas halophila]|uniref:hypothetical protein n=1 Tax=Natronomonas halophila TaxID=2747817 RepID=UPI0015B5F4E9|nr:hypothetical protein [Natronomonas halophila]QLD84784.1 hypothetical protein HWV23_03335 [Natronomonas halophila]